MANTIKMKQSSVASKVPTTGQLQLGELAINTNDGILYFKKNVSSVESIVAISASANYLPLTGGTLTGGLTVAQGASGGVDITPTGFNNAIVKLTAPTTNLAIVDHYTNTGRRASAGWHGPNDWYEIRTYDSAGANALLSAKCVYNAQVSLYYAGVERFATTSTGAAVSGNLTIDHPTATGDALRVTLSNGAAVGNAIIVEDQANPDSTPWLVSATGNVIHGYTDTIGAQSAQTTTQLAVGGKQQLHGTTTQLATILSTAWNTNSDVAPAYVMAKSANATVGTHTATVSGDVLGFLSWQGSDGTQFYRAADIRGVVNGTVSTGIVPGSLSFRVADTAGTLTERMLIANNGTTTVTGTLNATTLQEGGVNLSTKYALAGTSGTASFVSMAKWGTD